MICIGSLLLILILCCVVGNSFVIIAIVRERDLRSRPQYLLILSLASADFIVGLIVTPLGAWSTIMQEWNLGVTLCDFWISVDVLVCTSSILHLVAIALDRYCSSDKIFVKIFFLKVLEYYGYLLCAKSNTKADCQHVVDNLDSFITHLHSANFWLEGCGVCQPGQPTTRLSHFATD